MLSNGEKSINTVEAENFAEESRWPSILRWNGSVFSAAWKEFVAFVLIYLSLSLGYNYSLNDDAKREFEAVATYCSKFTSTLPIVLLLGFFTATAMQRSFSAVNTIPGCSRVITMFVTSLKGNEPEGPKYARAYARWVILSWTLAFRQICRPLKNKYPNLKSLVDAELLMPHEKVELETHSEDYHPLVVLDWCIAVLKECRSKFELPVDFNRNVEAILMFKKTCGNTLKFARRSIPIAMKQTVCIAVYMFMGASVLSRSVDKDNETLNLITFYVPLTNICHCFLFYLWMKFGNSAANPFGSGADDINMVSFMRNHMDSAARLVHEYSASKLTVSKSLSGATPDWMDLKPILFQIIMKEKTGQVYLQEHTSQLDNNDSPMLEI